MNPRICLDQLEHSQLVRQLNEQTLSYHFKHVLVQETAYSTLLLKDRVQLHHAVAAALEQTFGEQLDELATELAQHYARAGENRKAIDYFIQSGERAMRISAYPEAIQSFERALELCPADAPDQRADLLVRLGNVYDRRSDLTGARDKFEAALALAKQHQQATIAATALCGLASLSSRQGAHAQAQRLAEDGLEWAYQARDPKPTAQALRQLGISRDNLGENELAVNDLQNALGLYRELEDREGIANCLNSLGVVAINRRDFESAASYLQEALELSRELGDRHGAGKQLLNLGVIAEEQGLLEATLRYHQEALTIAQEIGDREGIAHVNLNLGGILVKQGDVARAMEHYRAALKETLELGSFALALYIVAAVGEVRVELGQYEDGAGLLGLAFTHPAGTADIKLDFEPVLEKLTQVLPADELQKAMQQGEALDLQSVFKEILSDDASGAIEGESNQTV